MDKIISSFENSDLSSASRCNSDKIPLERKAFVEGDHYLEKLEFALAVAEMRGDQHRSALLKVQIADLGGNIEEPGT